MRYISLLFLVLSLTACQTSSSKNYQIPDYEKMADRITDQTAKKIEAKTGLRLCGTGGGMMNHIRMMAMSFNCYSAVDMDKGRELVVYCVNEYLAAINANEEIRPHLIHYPFTPSDVEIRIFIYKPDRKDVPIGDLSVVSQAYGQVVYKVREPFPVVLKRVHEETFEEAVQQIARKQAAYAESFATGS